MKLEFFCKQSTKLPTDRPNEKINQNDNENGEGGKTKSKLNFVIREFNHSVSVFEI